MKYVELDARKTFQENIKKLINDSGLEQKEIALRINVSTSTVSDWVSGKSYPRIDAMQRLAELFAIPVDNLVGRYEPDWRSYLLIAYENGSLAQRADACKALNINYFSVGDDRELVGLAKILISQLNFGEIVNKDALDTINRFYESSKKGGKKGCSQSVYTACLEAILASDGTRLDYTSFIDDIEDDNSAISTLYHLTGHPYTPHVETSLNELLLSRTKDPDDSKKSAL